MDAILQELTYDALPEGAVWPFDRRYIRPRHFHGQLECLLISRGSAVLHLGTRAEVVLAGQLCWILPGMPHVMSEFSPDFDMWVVQLAPGLVDSCWADVAGVAAADAPGLLAGWSTSLSETIAQRAFPNMTGAIYAGLAAKAKPIMIPETASAEQGGDKAAWIAAILPALRTSYPAIKALVWFHMNKETDWRVDSTPPARDAFVAMARDAYFNP